MHTNVERLESTCTQAPTAYAAVLLAAGLSTPQERTHFCTQRCKPTEPEDPEKFADQADTQIYWKYV